MAGNDGRQYVPATVQSVWEGVGRPLDMGNLYSAGRFAHVTRERVEVVVWGRYCDGAGGSDCAWLELDFPCKPGSLDRRPCFTAPYHRRLAWQFWFVGLGHDATWLRAFCQKLVRGDANALLALEGGGPRGPDQVPNAVAADLYRYRFSNGSAWWSSELRPSRPRIGQRPGQPAEGAEEEQGLWWRRSFVRPLISPLVAGSRHRAQSAR